MTSVVIAAHNEATVIGRCLDALLADAAPGELDVTVVANGCTDATVSVAASRPGVRVVETAEAGKANALNLGETVAVGYPRIYLDADITVSIAVVRTLVEALDRGGRPRAGRRPVVAVVPRRELDLRGRPLLVRAYYAINSRLPAFRSGLFGRGMIALSEVGRRRFDVFPDMVADDLFLDSLFDADEKREATSVGTVVAVPRRTKDLVRRLVRVRRGNAAMRAADRAGEVAADVRHADRWAWLRDVVLRHPWLAPAAVVYVGITATAAFFARRSPSKNDLWGRDETTRTGAGAEPVAMSPMTGRRWNICFHGIGEPGRELEPGEDRYWIGVDQFHEILDEVAAWPNVRLSFDDGNSSDLEYGLPALLERGMTATFFVLAGRLGRPGSLAEDDVQELDRSGMTIGTHGMDHRPWRGLDHQQQRAEFVEARSRIARVIGHGVDQAALPLGRYDRALLRTLKSLGYATVYSSDRRHAREGSWLQARLSVRAEDSRDSVRAAVVAAGRPSSRLATGVKGFVKRIR